MRTAIFVDGDFFIRRVKKIYKGKSKFDISDPKQIVDELMSICTKHLNEKTQDSEEGKEKFERKHELYRIFFYDCPPLDKKAHKPVSKEAYDFGKTQVSTFRQEIHSELRKRRKTALRLGKLRDDGRWIIKPDELKKLLDGKKNFNDLKDEDFIYDVKQKSVDMKIGIDIASVAYKKQAERIVLISGDSDFVPAAKLARREGIDFILDPMYAPVPKDLYEHIDGLWSTCKKFERTDKKQ